jgi:uncharacterized protein (TIGR03435 family)
MTGSTISCAGLALLVSGIAFGQATPKPLEFEVASIKPHPPGETSSSMNSVPGGINATNMTLRQLILRGYEIQDFQLLGGPGWINDDRWDIMARTPDFVMPQDPNSLNDRQRRTIQSEMQERLRSLLADRFGLVVRRETREQPIYALVVAKNGTKLQPTKQTGSNNATSTNMTNGRGTATFTAVTTGVLAQQLAKRIGRPVVDKTGLTGKYDFKLEWTADVGEPGAISDGADVNAAEPSGPTIFTALQEQLGLRLESQKGPVDVIVIERVEKASEN